MKRIPLALLILMALIPVAGCTLTSVPKTAPRTTTQTSNATPATIPSPSSNKISGQKPDPYFSSPGYSQGTNYAPGGKTVTGITMGRQLKNRGGAGEVFVTISAADDKTLSASTVFFLDKDEEVSLQAHFEVVTTRTDMVFNWTARPASPGDSSRGDIQVTRYNMQVVGHLDTGPAKEIAVSGNFAYVLAERRLNDPSNPFMAEVGLKVIDVGNPSRPKEVGKYVFGSADNAFSKYGVRVADHYLFIVIGHHYEHKDNGLYIIDVADPLNPRFVSQYHTDGGASACGHFWQLCLCGHQRGYAKG